MDRRVSRLTGMAGAALTGGLVVLAGAGCGTVSSGGPGGNGAGSGSTGHGAASPAAAAATAAAAAAAAAAAGSTPSAAAAALPRASCGRTVTHGLNGNTVLLSSTKAAPSCFDTAARACEPAGLAVTVLGVDTGASDVFTISPDGKSCRVTMWHQSYSANNGGSKNPVESTPCRLTAVTGTGVTLSCAGQKLLIPARTG